MRNLFEIFFRDDNDTIFSIFFQFFNLFNNLNFFFVKNETRTLFHFFRIFFCFSNVFWWNLRHDAILNIVFFFHRNFFSFIRSQNFWDEQLFLFFYFFLQNAFYKLMMFSKLFKHFKLRSHCRKNDVDINIKFVIH